MLVIKISYKIRILSFDNIWFIRKFEILKDEKIPAIFPILQFFFTFTFFLSFSFTTGGESVWGGKFKDQFKSNLTHSGMKIITAILILNGSVV